MAHPGLPDAAVVIPERPALAPKARLRHDRASGGWLLLYPERGLALNPTAASVLKLCDGKRTVDDIVQELEREYGDAQGPALRQDVVEFLEAMARKGLVLGAG